MSRFFHRKKITGVDPKVRRVDHVDALEPRKLLAAASNDRYASLQYAIEQAGVDDAWATTKGSSSVIVADIDTGVDYTHPDLYLNIWVNQAEIPSAVKKKARDTDKDGLITFWDLNSTKNKGLVKDNNGNGYIDAGDVLRPTSQGGWEDGVNGKSNANDTFADDIIGWDFAENDNDPFDDGTANDGHGTHTAGIIGAVGNNGVGISGVAQKVSLMIVRIFTDGGTAVASSAIASAIRYTADSGARVSNNSWGGSVGSDNDDIYDAIAYAGSKGQLFVVAAGNDGRNIDSARVNVYPAEYSLSNIIVVSATTSSGSLAYYSNYGSTESDLAAPGDKVLSTKPGKKYEYESGTSMAAPMVTGAAALMLAANKSLTVAQLKARLTNGADESAALDNKTSSDGKLDVANAIANKAGVEYTAPTNSGGSTTNPVPPGFLFPPYFFFYVTGEANAFGWIFIRGL